MGEGPKVADFLDAVLPLCWRGQWLSMDEMMQLTKYHPSSIRWCLKQCKTGEEGEFVIRKRKRVPEYQGRWEWYIKRKPAQMRFPFREPDLRLGNELSAGDDS